MMRTVVFGRRSGLIPASLLALSLLPGCSAGPAGGSPAATPRVTPTPAVTQAAPTPVQPLTGTPLVGRKPGPVLAVKIDNVPAARPQSGAAAADIVIVEPVEYGLTRLLALFSSRLPPRIGPVRSARESDLDLLPSFQPALFYSGAERELERQVQSAPFPAAVDGGTPGAGFYRDRQRAASRGYEHSLYLDGDKALAWAIAQGVGPAPDVGLVFSNRAPAGGTPAGRVLARYRSTSMGAAWDPPTRTYAMSNDGRTVRDTSGEPVAPTSVLVLYSTVTTVRYADYGGRPEPVPKWESVGAGSGLLLRGGRSWSITWSRASESAPWDFRLLDGRPAPLAVGPSWWLLVDAARPVALTAPTGAASAAG